MSEDSNNQFEASEAYRRLRSTIKFAAVDSPIRSILVVDVDRATPSNVPSQLSEAFASAGDRCLLIHSDSRDTDTNTPGFSDLIAENASLTDISTLDYAERRGTITAGSRHDPDLIVGNGFAAALDAALESWEYVVLSAATLPRYGDAIALAPRVDAVILVVASGQTRRPQAIEAREALDRVGARVLGVVMVEQKRRWF